MPTRPVYWANEPDDLRADGWLLPFVSTFLAIPTYLFGLLLARVVPDYPTAPDTLDRNPRPDRAHNRSARVVAWFVTSSRRSALYKRAYRAGHRCHFIPSCGEY